MEEPIAFTSQDKNIKMIIKKQGAEICRDFISNDIIDYCLGRFDSGFVFMKEKAKIGRSVARIEDRFKIHSFVLLQEVDKSELHIHLICAEVRHKEKILMDHVINYAKDNEYLTISLNSLPDDTLVKWYEKLGFRIVDKIYKNMELKVVRMSYNFDI